MNKADILDIVNDFVSSLPLGLAMDMVDRLNNEFSVDLQLAKDKSYNEGWAEGEQVGKRQSGAEKNSFELARLRGIEKRVADRARDMVPEIVKKNGRDRKIACIKDLRNASFGALGLKDAKDAIDSHMADLERAENVWKCKDSSCQTCF